MPLPHDYAERVYAGVLGKIIGVYLGRPFEGWNYDRIMAELGEINYYVHEKRGTPLIVTDDDISGTFTFLRALPDYGNTRDLTPEQIGQTWLNTIIENRTILWWGGMGVSTEHTAFLRLKSGIPAPRSGSMETNGRVVAEQIGAQIFIDGWGMVVPGDPELAADFARRAASVSHDGEAIYGAQVIAAMIAAAFGENDIQKLIDVGLAFIPKDSIIARLIRDLREWHDAEKDWRVTREKIAARYGYDKYGGGCHMVPNHALIIHALLHGEGDFQKSLMIVNTCGWDTDCNSGNVGCLLGVRGGLASLEDGPDWRGPVADRIYLPTADGGRAVTDALREAFTIVNMGRALAKEPPIAPKNGARFHFDLPGAVQGFEPENNLVGRTTTRIENVPGHSRTGTRSLAIRFAHVATGCPARIATPTFTPPDALGMEGYGMIASPTLYPGQTVRAGLEADEGNAQPVTCRLYLDVYNENDKVTPVFGETIVLGPGRQLETTFRVPDTGAHPIAAVGIEIVSEKRADGTLYLDYLTWDGTPSVAFAPPAGGSAWQRAWVQGCDSVENGWGGDYRLKQNEGTGLLMQGCREWTDYRVEAKMSAHLASRFGIAARVQGMRRYYALLLCKDGMARLIKALDGDYVLAETEFVWNFDRDYELSLEVSSHQVRGLVDGRALFEVRDETRPLEGGGIALVCDEGHIVANAVRVGTIS